MLKNVYLKVRSMYQQAIFPYTPASLKRKVIFVHIPKAAGTAIRVALGEPETGRQHLPWWVYQQASPKKFQDFYKFAFVRHPLDRAYSGYKYLKAGGNRADDLSVAKYLESYHSFDAFVDGELSSGNMIHHPIFRPQSWYLCDWRGDVKVNYIGKFESVVADFQCVAHELKLKSFTGLPIINKSSERSEKVGVGAEKVIFEIYKDDFNLFDY